MLAPAKAGIVAERGVCRKFGEFFFSVISSRLDVAGLNGGTNGTGAGPWTLADGRRARDGVPIDEPAMSTLGLPTTEGNQKLLLSSLGPCDVICRDVSKR